ncbi:MAG: amidohydrolase [Candidatus Hodarchaeota archaeon]
MLGYKNGERNVHVYKFRKDRVPPMHLRKFLVFLILLFLTLIFISAVTESKESGEAIMNTPPDFIFYNGPILTMELNSSNVEAVAVQGDIISAVGNEKDIISLGGANTLTIDLEGETLLPGFIDSHSHWIGDRNLVNISDSNDVIEILVQNGWTSISELFVDGGWYQGRLDELQLLDHQGNLTIRVNAYLPLSWQFERFGNWYQTYKPGYEFSSKLRIGGVKIFMDRWYTQWTHYFNQSELETLVQEAHDLGYQIAIHSVVDNATDIVLNALETVLAEESNEFYRHRIEHLVLLRDDQIQRMKNLGIIASFQLSWVNSDWITLESFPYLENYSHLAGRWRDILEAGVPAIGSTDFPYNYGEMKSPLKYISRAVTRVGELGLQPTNWMLNQTLSVEQALRLLTIDAAYGTFQENIKGSIKEGKLADLVVLSDNPLTVSKSSLTDLKVLMTMIGGIIEYLSPDQSLRMSTRSSSVTTPFIPIGMALIPLIILGMLKLNRIQKY